MCEIKLDLENIIIVCDRLCHQMLLNLAKLAHKQNNVWKQSPPWTNPSKEYVLSKFLRLTADILLFTCPTQTIHATQWAWKLLPATGECNRSKKDVRSSSTSENMV